MALFQGHLIDGQDLRCFPAFTRRHFSPPTNVVLHSTAIGCAALLPFSALTEHESNMQCDHSDHRMKGGDQPAAC